MAEPQEIMELLRPVFRDQYMLVQVHDAEGREPYRIIPQISSDLGSLRGQITRETGYSYGGNERNCARYHIAIYKWDEDAEEWALIDYIPQGTHRREFSWRKGKE